MYKSGRQDNGLYISILRATIDSWNGSTKLQYPSSKDRWRQLVVIAMADEGYPTSHRSYS